ncbi:hypothetical protein ALI144C_44635 [Actinosynnema sp. ALI-1.44]|nr:hypothetical protein ALI144C_44635 [Actinosynnema sp. ALI-1.44]
MKRRGLVKKIAAAAKRQEVAWQLSREGANHSVYVLDTVIIPVPRHREIGENLAVEIFKECETVLGKGWWRS